MRLSKCGMCIFEPRHQLINTFAGARTNFEDLKARIQNARPFSKCLHVEIRIERQVVCLRYHERIHYREHGRVLVHLVEALGH